MNDCNDFSFQEKHTDYISDIARPLFDNLSVKFFSHTRAYHDGSFGSLMTDTALTQYNIEMQHPFFYSDGKGINIENGIYNVNHITEYLYGKNAQNDWSRFGLGHFICLIDHRSEYDDIYWLATDPENVKFSNIIYNHKPILNHFIHYYKYNARKMLKQLPKVNYPPHYFNQAQPGFKIMDNMILQSMPLKKIYIYSNQGSEVSLSNQEFICLKYLIQNYTMKEIAKILQLSPRTVETYFINLKTKLNCDNKADLIEVMRCNYIF